MRFNLSAAVFVSILALSSWMAMADNPKESTGFFGDVTGVIKSAEADGTSFILTVASTKEADNSTANADHMVGEDLCIGTRLPRDKDGTPKPHVADVAWIKTLKPGMEVTANVFAAKADPNVLRITKPGKITKQPTTQP